MSGDDRDALGGFSDRDLLRARLVEASRRVRLRRAVSRGARFALLSHLVFFPWLLLKALVPLPLGLYLLLLLVATTVGAVYGLFAPLPPASVARFLDHRFALKERLSSALEVMNRQGQPMTEALVHDAAVAAGLAGAERGLPISAPDQARYLVPVFALVAALFLLPGLPLQAPNSVGHTGRQGPGDERLGAGSENDQPGRQSPGKPRETVERTGSDDDYLHPGRRQAVGDLPPTFKDTAIPSERPDFASFLKWADERLKLLSPSKPLPDLERDYTRSPYQEQVDRMKETLRGAGLGTPSPEELERLLKQVRNLGHRPKGQSLPGEKTQGDMGGQERTPPEKRLEAIDRALRRLQDKGARRESDGGRTLKLLAEPRPAGADQAEGSEDWPEAVRKEGQEEGARPGRAPSPQTRDRPTPRVEARKLDSDLPGQSREGARESRDVDLSGRGARGSSRIPYLDMLTQYRRMAEEALSKERVPLNYQDRVKEYFKLLEE